MAYKNILTPELLRQLLRYEPETGDLFWLPRTPEFHKDGYRDAQGNCNMWNAKWAGKPALHYITCYGYRMGAVLGVNIQAHRAAYMIHHGCEIKGQIDHINGIRHDNRIENLRDVPRFINNRNAKLYSSNKTGVAGVAWEESHKAWAVKINYNGKQRRLGRFKNLEDAIAVRRAAEAEHGYSHRHGRPDQP